MKKVLFLIVFLAFSEVAFAQEKPGLLITPTRVLLDGRTRSASVSVANNGNVEGTYAISIVNRRMQEDGTIVPIGEDEEAIEGEKFAIDMLRISPRRITLQPGEHQNVRILARKPADLEDGEYRSHLNFKIVNEDTTEREKNSEQNDNSLIISIKANFGVTIPVIIRQGEVFASGQINDLKLVSNDDGSKSVEFDITRTGNSSIYGDIIILYKAKDGAELILKSMGGLAVYAPNKNRKFKVMLDVPESVSIDGGTLEVQYKAKAKEGGEILASKKIEL